MYSDEFQKLKKKVNLNMKYSVSIGLILFTLACFSSFFTEEKYIVNILFAALMICIFIAVNTHMSVWKCPRCDEAFGSSYSQTHFCPHCGINLEKDDLREKVRPPTGTPLNESKTKDLQVYLLEKKIVTRILKCPYCHHNVARVNWRGGHGPWGKWCYYCGAGFFN